MKKKNGYSYSTKPFEGWRYRAVFQVAIKDSVYLDTIHVYTNNTDRKDVQSILQKSAAKNPKWSNNLIENKIVHFASKEQDERASEFIDEFLN